LQQFSISRSAFPADPVKSQQLLYTLDVNLAIDLKLYEVEFRLRDAPEPGKLLG
jgi:hypothetical protein